MPDDNINKIDELLHNTQIAVVSKFCYDKKTQKYSSKAHVSAIYRGMITFIEKFVELGYTQQMLSDWVNEYVTSRL